MPRPKGSKNKPKLNKLTTAADYTAAIEAKTAEKAQLEQNVSETLDQINSLKAQLKADAQKTELESTVQKLLADGMSMDDIIGILNGQNQ